MWTLIARVIFQSKPIHSPRTSTLPGSSAAILACRRQTFSLRLRPIRWWAASMCITRTSID
jgi:hypothetical protein